MNKGFQISFQIIIFNGADVTLKSRKEKEKSPPKGLKKYFC